MTKAALSKLWPFCLLVPASTMVLGGDALYLWVWWLCLAALGLIALPLADTLFHRFRDRGYCFAKVLGLGVAGYAQWLLSACKILPFRVWTLYGVLALCLAASWRLNKKTGTYQRFWKDEGLLAQAVRLEVLLAALLLFWSYLRGIRPDILGLEKFMDFGFLNSILRADYFPPADMWFAGESINYYYLGHYFSAFLTRMSFLDSRVTYNLLMATLFALSFVLVYALAGMLAQLYNANAGPRKLAKYAVAAAGLLAGALVTLSGNLHTVIYAVFRGGAYWFPDATRYIGYNPDVPDDKTIHEFPLYSYVVSDLHAHVMNMLFVLTAVAVALAVCVEIMHRREEDSPLRLAPWFGVLIFLIGLFPATNFWDYPIYITVLAGLLLFANLRAHRQGVRPWLETLKQVLTVALPSYLVMLPFHLAFESMGTKIKLAQHHSLLYQLGVLWGYQGLFLVGLAALTVVYYRADARAQPTRASKRRENPGPLHIPEGEPARGLAGLPQKINPADALVCVFFICAVGLVIIPEIVYVEDIYPSHPRSNTMFKLTYQAFILFGLGVGYTFVRAAAQGAKKFARATAALCALGGALILCAFLYPFYAVSGWYAGGYQTLDGLAYMQNYTERFPDTDEGVVMHTLEQDYGLVEYIRQSIPGQPVILEAAGDAYTSYARISANTGLPTVMNWYYHQVLWRNSNTAIIDPRKADVHAFYTSTDLDAMREILRRYQVEYVVVGKLERRTYGEALSESLLLRLGEPVYAQGETLLIRVVEG
jgi:YYY domain-containing protein